MELMSMIMLSTYTLSEYGYDVDVLKEEITALKQHRNCIVTEENSMEHCLALMEATTHGKKFTLTGGLHLTSDNIFVSAEMSKRAKEKERLIKERSR